MGHPTPAETASDIQNRTSQLVGDINSGNISKVHDDMIADAKQYGVARAQEIYKTASQQANLLKLGFPSGSFLTGVHGDNVTAQTPGTDAQHPGYMEKNTHSVGTGDVQLPTVGTGATDLGTRGHSQFAANPDGSGTVTTGQGDALWTVAQKIIEQRQGRATQTDIGNLVNEITAYNRQTNPHFNPNNPPHQFQVPPEVRGDTGMAAPTQFDPARPGSRMATTEVPGTVRPGENSNLPPANGDVTAPIAPPGLGAQPGAAVSDSDTFWRNVDKTDPAAANGDVTRHYSGGLYNGVMGMFRTHFNADETVDKNGVLQHSHVDYSNPESMTIKASDGTTKTLDSVRSVDVQYNPGMKGYVSTYTSGDGTRVTTFTDSQGHVRIAHQANNPENPYAGWSPIT